jgi:exopolysaccharide biosynthesis protein
VADYSRTAATEITAGVEQYAETYDTVAGRQHIQVLTADLADPNVRAGVVAAHDSVLDPADEKTSAMADRTGAVAGVNGGYVDIDATGQPLGGVISDGTTLKSPQPGFAAQLGISQDGTHVVALAIDGHGGEDTAVGATPAEAAAYLVAHGAYTAELFDGGGSTSEVAREPGASTVSVLNTPSDLPGNTERPVADGLFFYSTAA